MTTKNINGINAARRANQAVAESALKRARELAEAAESISAQRDEDIRNAEITKRALEQEANDQLATIGEEVGQVSYVINGAPLTPDPAPTPESDAPAAPVEEDEEETAPAPTPEPDAPAAPVEEDEEVVEEAAEEQTVITHLHLHQRSNSNPQGWGWRRWWWIIAILTLVGLAIGAWLWDWFARDWYFGAGPTIGTILSIVHWIGWPALGFFTGGYISHRLEERRAHQLNQDDDTETTESTTPVVVFQSEAPPTA